MKASGIQGREDAESCNLRGRIYLGSTWFCCGQFPNLGMPLPENGNLTDVISPFHQQLPTGILEWLVRTPVLVFSCQSTRLIDWAGLLRG